MRQAVLASPRGFGTSLSRRLQAAHVVPSITVTATEQAGLHRSVTLNQITVSTVPPLSSHCNQKQKTTQKLSLKCTHGWTGFGV